MICSASLKAHQEISKKRRFKNYCSCDKVCQFSALRHNLSPYFEEHLRTAASENVFMKLSKIYNCR